MRPSKPTLSKESLPPLNRPAAAVLASIMSFAAACSHTEEVKAERDKTTDAICDHVFEKNRILQKEFNDVIEGIDNVTTVFVGKFGSMSHDEIVKNHQEEFNQLQNLITGAYSKLNVIRVNTEDVSTDADPMDTDERRMLARVCQRRLLDYTLGPKRAQYLTILEQLGQQVPAGKASPLHGVYRPY